MDNKHQETQDGKLAWLNFRNWNEDQGSKKTISKRALQMLQSLVLAKNKVVGVEAHILAFEDASTSLEEVGESNLEKLKKRTILDGILDIS